MQINPKLKKVNVMNDTVASFLSETENLYRKIQNMLWQVF